jgi:hypothetical protein
LLAATRARGGDADDRRRRRSGSTDASGARFRVRFDPGERLILGAGAETWRRLAGWRAPGFGVESGCCCGASVPRRAGTCTGKRNHELARLRLHPAAGRAAPRRRRALPRALPAPVARGDADVAGDAADRAAAAVRHRRAGEVGHLHGALWPEVGGAPVDAGIFHGEVLADFWRSRQPGRWLTLGVGGRYEVGLRRDAAGALERDHRVSPMSTLALAFHSERADGLAAGGVRAEASHRWSSTRGWERAYRVDADAEVTPLAANDRPTRAVRPRQRGERAGLAARGGQGDGGAAVLATAALRASGPRASGLGIRF